MKPIELRINKRDGYYTVDKVWQGVGNVSFGSRRFMTWSDVITWCRTEWPGVPILSNW